jgi:segregation and condensation protein A
MRQPQNHPVDPPAGLSLSLENFSGPLDLLLHLVREAKIEIKDVFVSKVTEQFLCFVREMDLDNIDLAGEYMEMAATLLLIKSRSLLPSKEKDEDGFGDPEAELISRLEEYKLLKESAEKLRGIETVGRFYRTPAVQVLRYTAGEAMKLDDLLDAFAKILHRLEEKERRPRVREITREVFTVNDKIRYIIDLLTLSDRLSFFALVEEGQGSKIEVVVTFSALLELIKIGYILIEQASLFDDIFILKNNSYCGEYRYEEDGH